MGTKGDDYAKAQEVFARLKNENDVVATEKLHEYLLQRGMSQEFADKALTQIDINQDNELSWVEFGTKGIKIIHELRLHEEREERRKANPNFSVEDEEQLELTIADENGDIKLEATIDENGEVGFQAVQTRVEDGEVIETKVAVDGEGKVGVVETTIGENGITVATVQETENNVEIGVVEEKIEINNSNGKEEVKVEETVFAAILPQVETKARDEVAEKFLQQVYSEVKKEAEARSQTNQRTLILGEQPNWAGTEPCEPQPATFLPSILLEGIQAISTRGYAVVELPAEVTENYSKFHSAFEVFSHSSIENKKRFATQQFETSVHSPNQFHGFSVVGGLKEQFMMRLAGRQTTLTTPGAGLPESEDLGRVGMKLYEQLDQLCRDTALKAAKQHGVSARDVNKLLDPIYQIGQQVERDPSNPEVCYSPYVPDGFISSSIMDNFHYYNTFQKKDKSDEKFHNNHAAHTDSGLLTVVVSTDEPGLEVFDQQKQQWIALETLIHEYTSAANISHRKFATIFWGDSVAYLKTPALQPTLHRVGKSVKERYSVVFKQRTSTLTTPCRYQEDYILQEIQAKSIANYKPTNDNSSLFSSLRNPLIIGTVALAVAIGVGFLYRK